MQVNRLGYRPWSGRLRPSAVRWLPIARCGLAGVLRRRIFWLFLLLGLLNFLFYFAVIYFVAQMEAEVSQRGGKLPPFVREATFTGTGKSYREFISSQGVVVMLLMGFAGSVLIGADFRSHAVAFYLAKPIGKVHYFLGKLGAAAGLTSLITLFPALILFVEYGTLTESVEYFVDSSRIFWSILAYGSLVSLSSAVLILGIAALFQKTIPIVVAWSGVFVFLPLLGEALRNSFRAGPDDAWGWALLDFWALLRWISNTFFGIREEVYSERLPYALLVVAIWMAAGLWLFWSRVRAVEVVR